MSSNLIPKGFIQKSKNSSPAENHKSFDVMFQPSLWANDRLRLILTGKCNINCFYCHNEGQPKSNNFFPADLFARVIELLASKQSHLDSVTFSGGEPLLHPLLEKFIAEVVPFTKSEHW